MHIYFILWVIIQILLSILFCSNNSSNCHWGLTQVGSCILLIFSFYLYAPFLSIPYFLPTRCCILILCFPCLRPKTRYVLRALLAFTENRHLETKIWKLDVLTAVGLSLHLRPFRGQS